MDFMDKYPLLDKLVEEKRYLELLDILIQFFKTDGPGLLWFRSNPLVQQKLFDYSITRSKYEILPWFKNIRYQIMEKQIEDIILDRDICGLDEIYRLKFYFTNNFAKIAVRENRIDILKWINDKSIPQEHICIRDDSIIEAIEYDRKDIIEWLIDNRYIWKRSIDKIIKTGKFYYFYKIYKAGYRGNYQQNQLIEDEHPQFITWIVNNKKISYPNDLYEAIEKRNIDFLILFGSLNCHLLYRKIATKLCLSLILRIYSIRKSKYFYNQISERQDFNLFLEKVNIKALDVVDIIT